MKKVNPNRIPATQADLKRVEKKVKEDAVKIAFAIFFTVMRDKEGYGVKRLNRIWAEVNDLSDSIASGYVKVKDLMKTLADEADIYLE